MNEVTVAFIKPFRIKGERAFKQTLNNGKINENVLREEPAHLTLWVSPFFAQAACLPSESHKVTLGCRAMNGFAICQSLFYIQEISLLQVMAVYKV